MIISIDGPTASGKSTVAHLLAKRLGFHCLSSGILYRGLAYILLHEFHMSREDLYHPSLDSIDRALNKHAFVYRIDDNNGGNVWFNNKNITSFLKSVEISDAASIISMHQIVRYALMTFQRALAENNNLIVEGRDIGSIVFPNAQVKFFLTASLEVRAHRLQEMQKKRGAIISLQEAQDHIIELDTRDRNRPIAPLIVPEGAFVIDNSTLPLEETLMLMLQHISSLNDFK